ncbi:MAG: TorD/DmsD family molecular chaperone [Anaerolineae bacterium]
MVELARLRQGCYRLAAALFLYPNRSRWANLIGAARELKQENGSLGLFPFFGPWQRLLTTLLNEDCRKIEGEYIRLFVVNPQAPPYESFYLDPERQITGWIVAGLEREYTERGLAVSTPLQEPPDHVAVELEFMAFMCGREAEAWERKVVREGAHLLQSEERFLDSHLKRWFPAFLRQVAVTSRTDLYGAAVEAVYAFLHHDQDLIALLLKRFQPAENGD